MKSTNIKFSNIKNTSLNRVTTKNKTVITANNRILKKPKKSETVTIQNDELETLEDIIKYKQLNLKETQINKKLKLKLNNSKLELDAIANEINIFKSKLNELSKYKQKIIETETLNHDDNNYEIELALALELERNNNKILSYKCVLCEYDVCKENSFNTLNCGHVLHSLCYNEFKIISDICLICNK